MRILFMGSGAIAEPTLEKLLHLPEDEVVAVVTQPDRPRGRKLEMGACPVKEYAESRNVTVLSPCKVGSDASVSEIRELSADLIIVAAYGQYIKPSILSLPSLGAINLHPSLLPLYRGAAPIQMAIADGRPQTGVTIMHVGEEMDAGDIILQEEVAVGPDDTAATMEALLAERGAGLMIRAVELLRSGEAPRIPQDAAKATYVKKLTRQDGRIDWTLPAESIRNRIRGFTPWPGSFCQYGSGRMLKILHARVEDPEGSPGAILQASAVGLLVGTGEKSLRLLQVQPEGKSRMSGADFMNGYGVRMGHSLG